MLRPHRQLRTAVKILPFRVCAARGDSLLRSEARAVNGLRSDERGRDRRLTSQEIFALVTGLAGAKPGHFVLLEGAAPRNEERLWLRCYRSGSMTLSFGFSRQAGHIRVAVQGLGALGLVSLQEPEFATVSAALDAARAVLQGFADLNAPGDAL